MPASPVSMVGITVSDRAPAGMPSEKSILGSFSGVTLLVKNQLVRARAAWLAGNSSGSPKAASQSGSTRPWPQASAMMAASASSVSSSAAPPYAASASPVRPARRWSLRRRRRPSERQKRAKPRSER